MCCRFHDRNDSTHLEHAHELCSSHSAEIASRAEVRRLFRAMEVAYDNYKDRPFRGERRSAPPCGVHLGGVHRSALLPQGFPFNALQCRQVATCDASRMRHCRWPCLRPKPTSAPVAQLLSADGCADSVLLTSLWARHPYNANVLTRFVENEDGIWFPSTEGADRLRSGSLRIGGRPTAETDEVGMEMEK